jgi:hypothetical protein
MGNKNEYLKQREAREQQIFARGLSTGMQISADFLQIGLREPEAVGKDIFGRQRIEKLLAFAMELDAYYSKAFSDDVEADRLQEEMDRKLREIYEDDLVPFRERYPYLKHYGYDKPRKGWV